jgi:hypothetical protein
VKKLHLLSDQAVIGTSYNYDNAWKICSEAIRNKWTWMLKDQRTWILCELGTYLSLFGSA